MLTDDKLAYVGHSPPHNRRVARVGAVGPHAADLVSPLIGDGVKALFSQALEGRQPGRACPHVSPGVPRRRWLDAPRPMTAIRILSMLGTCVWSKRPESNLVFSPASRSTNAKGYWNHGSLWLTRPSGHHDPSGEQSSLGPRCSPRLPRAHVGCPRPPMPGIPSPWLTPDHGSGLTGQSDSTSALTDMPLRCRWPQPDGVTPAYSCILPVPCHWCHFPCPSAAPCPFHDSSRHLRLVGSSLCSRAAIQSSSRSHAGLEAAAAAKTKLA